MTAPNELQEFSDFIDKLLKTEAAARMSPQQALAIWQEKQETLAAIREGLADVEVGRTEPADVAFRRLAEKYGFKIPDSEES